MVVLNVDPDLCSACFSCEYYLPELLKKINHDRLLISPSNFNRHYQRIDMAIKNCQMKALSLGGSK